MPSLVPAAPSPKDLPFIVSLSPLHLPCCESDMFTTIYSWHWISYCIMAGQGVSLDTHRDKLMLPCHTDSWGLVLTLAHIPDAPASPVPDMRHSVISQGNAKYICPHLRVLVHEHVEYTPHSPASSTRSGIQPMLNYHLWIGQVISTP